MENKSKFSTSELLLRGILFLIFACSIVFKLIVGMDNFEIGLMEANLSTSWVQSLLITNTVITLEVSGAIFALFGRFNWFQNSIFVITFSLYLLSILFSFNSTYYQDYTLIFFGFDIPTAKDLYFFGGYFLNITLFIIALICFIMLQRKSKLQLMKWPFQFSTIFILVFCCIYFGSLNLKQFKVKSEPYNSSITNWDKFNEAIIDQYPEILKDNWTIAFFSTGCDHCKKFARKISFSPGENKNILYVFWSEEDEISTFKKQNNISGIHLKLPQHVIMNIAGMEYPVFFQFVDGKPAQSYTGSEFSYAVMDQIFEE